MVLDTPIPMSQIPSSLLERIADSIHRYSTVLIKLAVDGEGQESVDQIGSGTFVSMGDIHGILTAEHVSRQLKGQCELGLAVIHHEHQHRIRSDYLTIIKIASADTPAEGPDLSLIVLPAPSVAAIRAVKSFYNLSSYKLEMLDDPPPFDHGIWFLCGAPAEKTELERSEAGFGGVKSYYSFCYVTGVRTEYVRGEYDYLEVNVRYGKGSDAPSSFGGMSGGGLWQVLIGQLEDGSLVQTKHLLSGVIFYQSALEDEQRFIRCHGRQSVYQNVLSMIETYCSERLN